MLRLLFVLAVSTGVVRGSGDAHGTFEWAGTFDVTAFDKVFWSAQSNEDGIYPDASMAIAVLVGNSDFSLTEELEHEGEEALADPDSCNPLALFAPLPISEHEDEPPACYSLQFPCDTVGSGDDAVCKATQHTVIYEIDTIGIVSIAIFGQHFANEFEREVCCCPACPA